MAISTDASLATIVQSFIALQSQTNHHLLEYMSKTVSDEGAAVQIDNKQLDNAAQKEFLNEIATKQNLMARQLEKSLHQQIANHDGLHIESDLHLINAPPQRHGEKVIKFQIAP